MTDPDRIAQAVRHLEAHTRENIADWLMAGAIANELAFDYEPPKVEFIGLNIVVTERFRFI